MVHIVHIVSAIWVLLSIALAYGVFRFADHGRRFVLLRILRRPRRTAARRHFRRKSRDPTPQYRHAGRRDGRHLGGHERRRVRHHHADVAAPRRQLDFWRAAARVLRSFRRRMDQVRHLRARRLRPTSGRRLTGQSRLSFYRFCSVFR